MWGYFALQDRLGGLWAFFYRALFFTFFLFG